MKEKKMYKVKIIGCDDITIINVELSIEEYDIIKRLCDLSEKTSHTQCEPTMSIEIINPTT